MELKIDEKPAQQFVTDLWTQITTTGFGSQSKNDFYDYVVYLFNKYDTKHFLTTNSVYENSQLLKVTNQKVKKQSRISNLNFIPLKRKPKSPLNFWNLSLIKR